MTIQSYSLLIMAVGSRAEGRRAVGGEAAAAAAIVTLRAADRTDEASARHSTDCWLAAAG